MMYGTVFRMRLKPNMEERLLQVNHDFEAAQVPGFVAHYAYRLDSDPQVYYQAAVFESKAAYDENATSPDQHTRYQQLMELLEGEPEWHDGEIVSGYPPR